ncbi:MAG: hypothetical protein K8I01_01405 [Candidatus Methylomirabilis sp.]|nr:hypothetical protein [Deltaproteobacteria bacterium]
MEGGFSPSSGTDVNPELEALREEAAGYEPLGAGVGISDPGPRAESGAAFPVDDALIGKVWALVFDRVAVGAGSHWKLTDEEEKQIGLMTKPVLAKYMPAVMSSTARSFVCWQLPG